MFVNSFINIIIRIESIEAYIIRAINLNLIKLLYQLVTLLVFFFPLSSFLSLPSLLIHLFPCLIHNNNIKIRRFERTNRKTF